MGIDGKVLRAGRTLDRLESGRDIVDDVGSFDQGIGGDDVNVMLELSQGQFFNRLPDQLQHSGRIFASGITDDKWAVVGEIDLFDMVFDALDICHGSDFAQEGVFKLALFRGQRQIEILLQIVGGESHAGVGFTDLAVMHCPAFP